MDRIYIVQPNEKPGYPDNNVLLLPGNGFSVANRHGEAAQYTMCYIVRVAHSVSYNT